MSYMTFGDFAVVNKPIPNYNRGTVVQIASVSVVKGRVQYSAVVLFKDKLTDIIGPYPDMAFVFVRNGTEAHCAALIKHLEASQ
jgi:hypothetical protein